MALQRREMTLELQQVSPLLAAITATAIPVPGQPLGPPAAAGETGSGGGGVTIAGVAPLVSILKTKTRPKKLALLGSDGQRYSFLLKVRCMC